MTPTDRPSKQEAFLTFLQDGWVTVYVDARRPGVSVPEHLRNEARLVLQYGLNMPVPVEDLQVTDDGIKATLSFSRQPHNTLIPWTAVYVIACTDGRGVLYQEDVPAELLAAAADAEAAGGSPAEHDADDNAPDGAADGPGSRLTSVPAAPGEASEDAATSATGAGAHPSAPARPPRARLKSVPMPDEAPAESDAASAGAEDEEDTPPPDKPRGRPSLHLVK